MASAAWIERRSQWYKTHGAYCRACQATSGLQLHHQTYRNLGHEADGDLIALCGDCHGKVHALVSIEHFTLGQATRMVIGSRGAPDTIPIFKRPKPPPFRRSKQRADGRRVKDIFRNPCPTCGADPSRRCKNGRSRRHTIHKERAELIPAGNTAL